MPKPEREPVTKEHLRIDPPKGKGMPDHNQPMRQTPPPIPKSRIAHAGRERLEDTPLILDPEVAVRISGGLRDSADIRIDVENSNPLEMEADELRNFIRKARCVDRKEFIPERFGNSIMIANVKREGGSERGTRFVFIRTDDGQVWRLYPAAENMSSVEKYEKCRFTATVEVDGKHYFLYWETPDLKQK